MENEEVSPRADNRIVAPIRERTIAELKYWTPSLVCLIGLIIAEIPLMLHPFTESYMGLRLDVSNIHPEAVFQPALDRVDIINPLGLAMDLDDTQLERYYDLNDHGVRVSTKAWEEMTFYMANGSIFDGSLYKDFPRALIQGSSPSILNGQVPLISPEDINVPLVSEDTINGFFKKALVLRNEERIAVLKGTGYLAVVLCVLCIISVTCGGFCVLFLSFIAWMVKLYSTPFTNADDTVPDALMVEQLCQSFNSHYEELGIFLRPVSLFGFYSGLWNGCAILFGILSSFVMGFFEMNMYYNYKFVDDKGDPDGENFELESIV